MSYSLVRTGVSLDRTSLGILDDLAKQWSVSKAEVMRRALRKAKAEADLETQRPSPLDALEWLQNGGGLTVEEGAGMHAAFLAERQAKRYWWEP
ncbi:MAG: ribbon-helix-helix protein, CopG family [Verrucomicrobiota bacterium]